MISSQLFRSTACLAALILAISTTACASPKTAKKESKAKTVQNDTEYVDFTQWKAVSEFIDRLAEKDGFDRTELQSLFRKTRYVENAIQLMKPAPPGKPKNWHAYRARFVEPVRINAGVAFWNTYADQLARAEEQYGVPAEIIVGILGVETIYGRNTGNFRVMDAITTLAFDYPDTPTREARMEYFRGELENTLLFARESNIDPFSLTGSYAGAIGWPQFMPGSIRKFAVDFDGDGKIDLRNSPVDAIGSVAHFLSEHGWKRGDPVVFPASVTETAGNRGWDIFINQGLEAKFTIDEMKAAGVVPSVEPPADLRYGLIDLQNGGDPTDYWLGTGNFFAITQYNRSFFYAMSVIDLGKAVRTARGG